MTMYPCNAPAYELCSQPLTELELDGGACPGCRRQLTDDFPAVDPNQTSFGFYEVGSDD